MAEEAAAVEEEDFCLIRLESLQMCLTNVILKYLEVMVQQVVLQV